MNVDMNDKRFFSLNNRFLAPLIIAAGALLLGFELQSSQEYMFHYRESQQLLFLDWSYIADLMMQFGGVGIFLSQWLVQFFIHPIVGAAVTAIIAGVTVWMLWLSLRKINDNIALLPLAFAPSLIQILYLVTPYLHYSGLVALMVMAIALWGYTLCNTSNYKTRIAVGAALTLALYLLFGSVGMLFAVCALLFDAATKRERWYLGAIYAAVVCIAGSYMVQRGEIIDYEFAYTPKFYNEFYVEMTPFLNLAWVASAALFVVAFALGFVKNLNRWITGLAFTLLCVVVAGSYTKRHTTEIGKSAYHYMAYYHHIVTEDWDAILNTNTVNYQNPLNNNIVNFALSKKGELLDKLFLYPQPNGSSSLLNEQMGTFVEEHSIYSEIYYHLGIVSQTLELSLAAMAGTYPGTPLLLQQFIRSRVVMGDYDLAGKFVYRLENTYAYKDWALKQREFLHNDEAVEADEEYGLKRRTLPELSSEFVSMQGLLYDLMKALTANPDNNVAREYAIACLLLQKNFDNIRYFVEEYYGTPILPTMPVRLQEAILTYSERDMDYCRRYGVSEQTISRFASFRQKILTLRHRQPNANPKSQMSEFRDTFWYYMLN